MSKHTLQHFELHVLLAMLRERDETYSVPLVLALERRMGRRVSQAAVFIALKRLERKDWCCRASMSRMKVGHAAISG
jgi:hypothetical protein